MLLIKINAHNTSLSIDKLCTKALPTVDITPTKKHQTHHNVKPSNDVSNYLSMIKF